MTPERLLDMIEDGETVGELPPTLHDMPLPELLRYYALPRLAGYMEVATLGAQETAQRLAALDDAASMGDESETATALESLARTASALSYASDLLYNMPRTIFDLYGETAGERQGNGEVSA